MAKVGEKPELKSAGFQVIENLSAMLVSEFADGFQFDGYLVVADKIGKIFLAENSPSVLQRQSRLRDCGDVAMHEFNGETLLIYRLVKAAAFVFANFEARTNNDLTFILEEEVRR